MGAFAQFERELIRERQKEGIELAKRTAELGRRLAEGEGKAALAREFGVDRATVYPYMGREAKPAAARRSGAEK